MYPRTAGASTCLSAGLLFVVACAAARGATDELRLEAARDVLLQRQAAVGALLGWLSQQDIPPQQDRIIAAAFLILGELRQPEAVPLLARHWSFFWSADFHATPADYPAILSLAAIGLPAMPALTEIAAQGYNGEEVGPPLTDCLSSMAHGRMIREMLQQAADAERDPGRARRLRSTARDVGGRGSSESPEAIIPAGLANWPRVLETAPPPLGEAFRVMEQCEAAVKALSDWLLSIESLQEETRETQRAAVEAMEILGKFRLPEGIPGLKKHWKFVRPGEDGKELEDYPALVALREIGLPSFEALMDIAVEGDEGEAITWPLSEVFAKMGPADAVAEFIEWKAGREIDPDRYKRLMATAAAVRQTVPNR
ncbi:MAG: hypothetical protein ACE5O2_02120 [Armatimonadota bacterium]